MHVQCVCPVLFVQISVYFPHNDNKVSWLWLWTLIIFTISCATASGSSLTRSKVNSIAPVSLYFPFSFLGSSTQSFRAMEDFFPSSSSLSSTRTPVSSAKKAWFRRSLMEYLQETHTHTHQRLTHTKGHYGANDVQHTQTSALPQPNSGCNVRVEEQTQNKDRLDPHAWRLRSCPTYLSSHRWQIHSPIISLISGSLTLL